VASQSNARILSRARIVALTAILLFLTSCAHDAQQNIVSTGVLTDPPAPHAVYSTVTIANSNGGPWTGDNGRVTIGSLPSDWRPITSESRGTSPDGKNQYFSQLFGSETAHAMILVVVERGPTANFAFDQGTAPAGDEKSGKPIRVRNNGAGATQVSVGWSPTSGVVAWVGTNKLSVDQLIMFAKNVEVAQ
jgi:hypothetical protein